MFPLLFLLIQLVAATQVNGPEEHRFVSSPDGLPDSGDGKHLYLDPNSKTKPGSADWLRHQMNDPFADDVFDVHFTKKQPEPEPKPEPERKPVPEATQKTPNVPIYKNPVQLPPFIGDVHKAFPVLPPSASKLPIPQKISELICPYKFTRWNGKCYKAFSNESTYNDARVHCKKFKAKLVSIQSQSENDFVTKLSKVRKIWTGLRHSRGRWFWTDKTPLDFLNFEKDEPNGCCGRSVHCVVLNSRFEAGKWSDVDCYAKYHGYVCKFDPNDKRVRDPLVPAKDPLVTPLQWQYPVYPAGAGYGVLPFTHPMAPGY